MADTVQGTDDGIGARDHLVQPAASLLHPAVVMEELAVVTLHQCPVMGRQMDPAAHVEDAAPTQVEPSATASIMALALVAALPLEQHLHLLFQALQLRAVNLQLATQTGNLGVALLELLTQHRHPLLAPLRGAGGAGEPALEGRDLHLQGMELGAALQGGKLPLAGTQAGP